MNEQPSEYLKLKYAASDCKCGDCQLVPHGVIRDWVARFEAPQRAGMVATPWGYFDAPNGTFKAT